jgi:predicted Zn-dependent peptidase
MTRLLPALALAASSLFAAPTAHAANLEFSFQPREWTFPSEYRMLYLADRRFDVITMSTTFPVGVAHSPDDRPDLAHLAAHLWFRTDVDGFEVKNWLDAMGCEYDADVAVDHTTYSTSCPSRELSRMLRLHTVLLQGQFEGLTQDEVAIEAAGAAQQMRWRDGQANADAAQNHMRHMLFPADHAFHMADPTPDSFEDTKLDEVLTFVGDNYKAPGAISTVIGDVEKSGLADEILEQFPPTFFHPDLTADNLSYFPSKPISWLGYLIDLDHPHDFERTEFDSDADQANVEGWLSQGLAYRATGNSQQPGRPTFVLPETNLEGTAVDFHFTGKKKKTVYWFTNPEDETRFMTVPEDGVVAVNPDGSIVFTTMDAVAGQELYRANKVLVGSFKFDHLVRWFEDPNKPGEYLDYAQARDPRSRKGPLPPNAPAKARMEAEVPYNSDALVVGWSLPGSDATGYWPMERLGKFATGEMKRSLEKQKGFKGVTCSSFAGTDAGMLYCVIKHSDSAKLDSLEKAALGTFDDNWSLGTEERLVESVGVDDALGAKIRERDRAGTEVTAKINRHLLSTDHAMYFDRKYGQKGGAIISSVRGVVDRWVIPERAAVLQITATETDIKTEPQLLADAERVALKLPGDLAGDDVSTIAPPISDRTTYELPTGIEVELLQVEGLSNTSYTLVFPDPEGTNPAVALYADRWFFDLEGSFDKTLDEVGYGGTLVGVQHRDGYTLVTPSNASFFEKKEFIAGIYTRLQNAGPPKSVKGKDLKKVRESLEKKWKPEYYWFDQAVRWFLEGNEDSINGITPDDLDEAIAMDDAELQAWFDAKFHPENGHFVVTGRFREDTIREELDILKRWKGEGTPGKPAKSASTVWTPDSATWLWPYGSGDISRMEVQLICPFDIDTTDYAKRSAHAATTSALVRAELWSRIADNAGVFFDYDVEAMLKWDGAGLEAYLTLGLPDAVDGVALIQEAIAAVAAGEFSDTDLERAHRYVLESERQLYASSPLMKEEALSLLGNGVGLDYMTQRGDTVRAVSTSDVVKAAKGCAGHELIIYDGPKDALVETLEAASVEHEVYDWKAKKKERMDK